MSSRLDTDRNLDDLARVFARAAVDRVLAAAGVGGLAPDECRRRADALRPQDPLALRNEVLRLAGRGLTARDIADTARLPLAAVVDLIGECGGR